LYFFVFKKIFAKLDERKQIISEGIENSKLSEEKLIEAQEKSGEIISQARIESSEKINSAIKTAQDKKDEIVDEAKKKAGLLLENAKKDGEKVKKDIILEADKEIVKNAILGAEKILSEK
jgi:F0F1-type ATP synthase membrane subunit b/b'